MSSIRVRGLVKRYGDLVAVDGIDLEISAGKITALLGPNGSGKSTTVRCLCGLSLPDAGSIEIGDSSEPLEIKRKIGVLVDNDAFFPGLSIEEHLIGEALVRGIAGETARSRSEDLLRYFDLWEKRHGLAEHGSVGMRKKLGIAMAMIHRPPTLILDEPFEGLDPVATQRTAALLDQARNTGTAVLVTSHLLTLSARLADDVALIQKGRIQDRGGAADLEQRYRKVFDPEPAVIPSWLV